MKMQSKAVRNCSTRRREIVFMIKYQMGNKDGKIHGRVGKRQKWTESKSIWISLTKKLRLEIESNCKFAEKKMELDEPQFTVWFSATEKW